MRLQSKIAANISEGIYLVSAKDLRIVYANPKMEEIFGYEPGEINGKHVSILYTPAGVDPAQTANQIEMALRETGRWSGEVYNIRKNGTPFWGYASISAFNHPEYGEVYVSLQTDITARKQIEEALCNSEILLRRQLQEINLIYKHSPVGLFVLDRDLRYQRINEHLAEISGKTVEEHLGRTVDEVLPELADTVREIWRPLLENGEPIFDVEVRGIVPRAPGVIRYWLASYFPIKSDTGEVMGLSGAIMDITERKHMEEAFRRSHNELELRVQERTAELTKSHEQLRSLAAHLQSVLEEERKKIARDIHDELGQALAAQKMELHWFRYQYGDHEQIFDKAGSMLSSIDLVIQSLRRICTELRPPILDDFGLAESMEWQADEFQERTGIRCTIIEEPSGIELDKEQSIVIYRIFQEALTNVLKHANATEVTARLMRADNLVILEVMDNGKGITEEQLSKPQSFGLIGMRERVYPWGGNMEITRQKSGGTILRASLPFSKKSTDEPTL